MRVAMYYSNKDIRIEEMPKPEIKEREILIKVIASSICGSDVMEWYRKKKAPIVLGHEVTGEIIETGRKVKKFKKGERVFVTHHVPCNKCFYCRNKKETVCSTLHSTNFFPGGFSEFIRVPEINVKKGTFILPKEISFEEGTFIEPLGCCIRGQRIAGMKNGCSVLVIGSGISGLLHIQLAKVLGAEKIIATDVNEYRLKAAKKFGADETINAREDVQKKFLELNQGKLADLVIVCTSAVPAFTQAFQCVDKGGTILVFAPTEPEVKIPLNLNDFWLKGVTLTTSYAAVKEDILTAIELIKKKKVNVKGMITHRLGLNETGKGFSIVSEAKDSIKVIINPAKV